MDEFIPLKYHKMVQAIKDAIDDQSFNLLVVLTVRMISINNRKKKRTPEEWIIYIVDYTIACQDKIRISNLRFGVDERQ